MIFQSYDFKLSDEDYRYLIDTYKTDRFLRPGENPYYSGYHAHPNSQIRYDWNPGKQIDRRLINMYTPFLSEKLREQGLDSKNMILSYSHIWAQIYMREMKSKNEPHNHYTSMDSVCSWIHFVDVPDDQDCLYFQIGKERVFPENQRSGKIIFFPSWAMHGVDAPTTRSERVVVAGNVIRKK